MTAVNQLEFIRRIVFQVAEKQIHPKAAMELIEVYLRDSVPQSPIASDTRKRRTVSVENGRRIWSAAMDKEMVALLNSGHSVKGVASRLGRTERAIDTRIQNLKRVRAMEVDDSGHLQFLMEFSSYEAIVKAYQARSKR
jgi:hypothetical protein